MLSKEFRGFEESCNYQRNLIEMGHYFMWKVRMAAMLKYCNLKYMQNYLYQCIQNTCLDSKELLYVYIYFVPYTTIQTLELKKMLYIVAYNW